jgi:hypothetical protein
MLTNNEEYDISLNDSDFEKLKSLLTDYDVMIIRNVYNAVCKVEGLYYLRNKGSLNWYSDAMIKRIYTAAEESGEMSHSGSSFIFGLKHIEYLVKNGKTAYMLNCER